jgi:hypothetical protein
MRQACNPDSPRIAPAHRTLHRTGQVRAACGDVNPLWIRPKADDVVLVTDLLDNASFPAPDLLDHYLSRWGVRGVFQQVTWTLGLEGLIGSTPEATVFHCDIFMDVTEEVATFDMLLNCGSSA